MVDEHPHRFPEGLQIAAVLMMVFGLAEIVTSLRHDFFGLTTSKTSLSTLIAGAIGLFYFSSGMLVLTKRKKAAIVAIILLISDAIGRVLMVLTGLYPMSSAYQIFGIITGTFLVIFFSIYIALKLKAFK